MKFLVIEDEIVIAFMSMRKLAKFNIEADHVISAEEGIEAISRENYDLVLMDIGLPGIDGIEATRRIREINPDIPIVALSANYEGDIIKQCQEAGMNDGLMKPLSKDKIEYLLSLF